MATRGGSASLHEGPGRPGARGRAAGETRGTRAPRARAARARRLSLGRRSGPLCADRGWEGRTGGEERRGGERGGRGRGEGRGRGAPPPFHPTSQRHSGAHSHPDSHPAPPRRGAPGGGGSAPAPPPPRPPLAQVSPPGPRHPGRAPRSAGRRARRPSPRPPGARPEIAGLPTSKSRPAHQSARAARRLGLALTRGPRARSAPRPRGRPGQGLGPGPRIGSPPRPRAPPGRSRRRGTWGSRAAGEGVRGTRRRGRGQRRAPPPLFLRKIRVGLAPAAAALGPSGPRPARLSTRAPLPATTPGTQRPPGASNKNCAVDFTVHFKGASRRTVLKGRYAPAALRAVPGAPAAPLRGRPARGRPPGRLSAGPDPLPRPAPATPLGATSPPARGGPGSEAARPGPRLRPHLLQHSFRRGRRAPWTPGGPAIHDCEGLFLFPGARVVTELPGPYQSAAGSSRLPRAGPGPPVIPPRQSLPRSAGPRLPP